MMAMASKSSNCFSCCNSAAAGSSARNIPLLDTAISLVVSICVLCLGLVRIILPQ